MGLKPEIIPFDSEIVGRGEINSDKTTTPASLSIDIHYANLGVQGAWNKERVLRLCGWIRITKYELASLILLPHRQMDEYMEKDLFPGPVALLLTIFELNFAPGVMMDPVCQPGDTVIPTHLI